MSAKEACFQGIYYGPLACLEGSELRAPVLKVAHSGFKHSEFGARTTGPQDLLWNVHEGSRAN